MLPFTTPRLLEMIINLGLKFKIYLFFFFGFVPPFVPETPLLSLVFLLSATIWCHARIRKNHLLILYSFFRLFRSLWTLRKRYFFLFWKCFPLPVAVLQNYKTFNYVLLCLNSLVQSVPVPCELRQLNCLHSEQNEKWFFEPLFLCFVFRRVPTFLHSSIFIDFMRAPSISAFHHLLHQRKLQDCGTFPRNDLILASTISSIQVPSLQNDPTIAPHKGHLSALLQWML